MGLQLTTLLHRAGLLGAGRGATAVRWPPLNGRDAGAVQERVRRFAQDGRQSDSTTCGSAVLVMLAATGDPVLARWLATGRLPDGPVPPELADAPLERYAALRDAPAAERFAVLQRAVKRRTCRGALLGLPWPEALGTPPWAAARVARFPGVRYGHRPVDDTDPAHVAAVVTAVAAALARGVPVPLYSGGDTSGGMAHAVPRHVVLAAGVREDRWVVWEPGSGAVTAVHPAVLLAGDRPQRALGGWSHVVWVLLPHPVGGPGR